MLGLAVATGGCGTSPDSAAPAKTEQSEQTAETAKVEETTDGAAAGFPDAWKVGRVTYRDRVVDRHGDAAAEEAATVVQDLLREYTASNEAVEMGNGERPAAREWLLAATAAMTRDAATDWRQTVRLVMQHGNELDKDTKEVQSLWSLASYKGVSKKRYASNGSPPFTNRVLKSMEVDLWSDGRIWVTAVITAALTAEDDGKDKRWMFRQEGEFWLTEVSGRWLVDGWNSSFDASKRL